MEKDFRKAIEGFIDQLKIGEEPDVQGYMKGLNQKERNQFIGALGEHIQEMGEKHQKEAKRLEIKIADLPEKMKKIDEQLEAKHLRSTQITAAVVAGVGLLAGGLWLKRVLDERNKEPQAVQLS